MQQNSPCEQCTPCEACRLQEQSHQPEQRTWPPGLRHAEPGKQALIASGKMQIALRFVSCPAQVAGTKVLQIGSYLSTIKVEQEEVTVHKT